MKHELNFNGRFSENSTATLFISCTRFVEKCNFGALKFKILSRKHPCTCCSCFTCNNCYSLPCHCMLCMWNSVYLWDAGEIYWVNGTIKKQSLSDFTSINARVHESTTFNIFRNRLIYFVFLWKGSICFRDLSLTCHNVWWLSQRKYDSHEPLEPFDIHGAHLMQV